MALLLSEVYRIRAETGYNVMGITAIPYIDVTSIFDSVIQQYINPSEVAVCSTTVPDPLGVPTPTTLTLSVVDSFLTGARVIVDVDSRQEVATIQSVSGSTIQALLSLPHSGTYPVTVEGGESIIREKLRQLYAVNGPGGAIEKARRRAGIQQVDEIIFFGGTGAQSQGKDPLTVALELQEFYRDELASFLGIPRYNKRGGGGGTEPY